MAAAVLSVSRGASAPLATASSKVSLNLRWVALKTVLARLFDKEQPVVWDAPIADHANSWGDGVPAMVFYDTVHEEWRRIHTVDMQSSLRSAGSAAPRADFV